MARQMTRYEIAHLIECLQICDDDEAKEALRLMRHGPKAPQEEIPSSLFDVYVVDDLSHDMWLLKPCGFLVCPEIDL